MSKFLFVGTPFQMVGGADTMKVGDFKTNCPDDEDTGIGWVPNGDSIVQLTPGGSFLRKLVYIPKYMADENSMETGWYDQADIEEGILDNCYNETPMPFGKAVQVCVDGNDAQINFAGEVKKTPTITPVAGFMGVANCACKKLFIKDVKTNCPDDEDTGVGFVPNGDSIVILTEGGSFLRKLVYIPKYMADENSMEKGWYDQADIEEGILDNCYNEKQSWEAGYGFQVCVDGENALIQIDPAITDEAK